MRSLGGSGSGEAEDGPGDREILATLMSGGERNEDPIIEATRRIGRLTEICEGVAAIGVGASDRFSAVRWGVAGNILVAWVLTIPASGFVAWLAWELISRVL